MGILHGNKSMVTDGLLLYLDSINPVSWIQGSVADGASTSAQTIYTTEGSYEFIVPEGVTQISAVCIGCGGAGGAFSTSEEGGGGGGGIYNPGNQVHHSGGGGGSGGGGSGAPARNPGQNGTANTGGGGGGTYVGCGRPQGSTPPACRGSGGGGSGVVIIRYRFQGS